MDPQLDPTRQDRLPPACWSCTATTAGPTRRSSRSLTWIEEADEAALEAPLPIPWFDFRVRARQGLLQVLTHSSHHRSQVLSFLGARGIEVPDLDYLLMLRERQGL
jgi:uncharacterized damage-inducible protein DinB